MVGDRGRGIACCCGAGAYGSSGRTHGHGGRASRPCRKSISWPSVSSTRRRSRSRSRPNGISRTIPSGSGSTRIVSHHHRSDNAPGRHSMVPAGGFVRRVDPPGKSPVENRSCRTRISSGDSKSRIRRGHGCRSLCIRSIRRGLSASLHTPEQTPPGMVHVTAGDRPRVALIAGLDHLPPQRLRDFWIDRYEVTNREFKRFVDAGGYRERKYWHTRSSTTAARSPSKRRWRASRIRPAGPGRPHGSPGTFSRDRTTCPSPA